MWFGTDLWLRQRGQKLCRPSWGKGPLTLGRSRNRCREDFTTGRDRQTLHWGFCEGKFKRRGDPRWDSQDRDCRQGSCPGKGRREGWAANVSFSLASRSHPANSSTTWAFCELGDASLHSITFVTLSFTSLSYQQNRGKKHSLRNTLYAALWGEAEATKVRERGLAWENFTKQKCPEIFIFMVQTDYINPEGWD